MQQDAIAALPPPAIAAKLPLMRVLQRLALATPPDTRAIGIVIECAEDAARRCETEDQAVTAATYWETARIARAAMLVLTEACPEPDAATPAGAIGHARALVRVLGLTDRHLDELRGVVAAEPLHRLFSALRAACALDRGE